MNNKLILIIILVVFLPTGSSSIWPFVSDEIFIIQRTTTIDANVTQLIAGTNITLDPASGLGIVTISSTGGGGDSNAVGFTKIFTNSDLVLGVLVIDHNLNRQYPQAQVIDDNDELVLPDTFEFTDSNTLTVDLNSFSPIANTWRVVLDSSH